MAAMAAESFVEVDPEGGFGLANLPWGVFSRTSGPDAGVRTIGVALGEQVVDVRRLADAGLLSGPVLSQAGDCLRNGTLNEFMSLGRPAWREARSALQRLLSKQEGVLRDNASLRDAALLSKDSVQMHLPANVGDYTDFYASREHAFNCGALFRGAGSELQPNWVHLPVGYHGRASSIVVSGTSVRRPWGQVLPQGASTPQMRPCAMLDYELEMACFIGTGNALGEPVRCDDAPGHIFGMVLMNDWSARDIQKWEIVPLGPFNSKNFATQISPWIVTPEALDPFAVDAPRQDPEVLPYLQQTARITYDVAVATDIVPAGTGRRCRATTTNFKHMYYTWPQMIAHHTLGGCNMRPGDLIASGTISGGAYGKRGCLFEATSAGREPLRLGVLPGGQQRPGPTPPPEPAGADAVVATRVYLEDMDEVVMSGWCEGDSVEPVSFGECRGVVLPAREA